MPVLERYAFRMAFGAAHFGVLPRGCCVDIEDCEVEVVPATGAIAWHQGLCYGVSFFNQAALFFLWSFEIGSPADALLVRRLFHGCWLNLPLLLDGVSKKMQKWAKKCKKCKKIAICP